MLRWPHRTARGPHRTARGGRPAGGRRASRAGPAAPPRGPGPRCRGRARGAATAARGPPGCRGARIRRRGRGGRPGPAHGGPGSPATRSDRPRPNPCPPAGPARARAHDEARAPPSPPEPPPPLVWEESLPWCGRRASPGVGGEPPLVWEVVWEESLPWCGRRASPGVGGEPPLVSIVSENLRSLGGRGGLPAGPRVHAALVTGGKRQVGTGLASRAVGPPGIARMSPACTAETYHCGRLWQAAGCPAQRRALASPPASRGDDEVTDPHFGPLSLSGMIPALRGIRVWRIIVVKTRSDGAPSS
jgi:hypothetical protein